MQNVKSVSLEDKKIFCILLQNYGLYKPETLYKLPCPFHNDVNPSLQINIDKAFFFCYGCGAKGTSYDLIHYAEPNLNSFKILKKIQEIRMQIRGEEGEGDYRGSGCRGVHVYTNLYNKNNLSNIKTESNLLLIKQSRDYFFNLPTTNWYKPPEEAINILLYMKQRGFTSSMLKRINAKFTYKENYPIVFPMFDNSVFKGYVMRTNDPFVEDQRKYLYNKGFKRRTSLIGNYKNDTIVIVEGFLDMLKTKQFGINFVAAILGWKITENQIQKIKRNSVKKIICALDNDECGKKGYKYLKRVFKNTNISVVRIRYPKKMKDMGDLNKQNSEMILRQIKNFGGK